MTNEIIQVISAFIGNGFVIAFSLICWNKLESLKKNKIQLLFIWLSLSIIITAINCIFSNPYKIIINFLILIIIKYFVITKNLKTSIITVVISQMILAINEFVFIIVCSVAFGNEIYELLFEPLPSILLNMCIFCVSSIIIQFKFIKRIYDLFNNNTKNKENIIYPLIIILILVISTAESHMKLPITIVLITNTLMAVIFISIIIMSTKIQNNYNKISSKYQTSISSLKEYEVMINQFSMYSHENRNEFYTVRNMLRDGDKKEDVIKYIDALINNKIKDNEKIMKKTAKIPSGGLRATIYSKLCLMDELNIKHSLNISRDVKTTDLIELDENIVLKICNILGVFLDNAIDAVKDLKKKIISIEIYIMDSSLCIDITNNFKGNLDLDKIAEAKYTTKGDGHGYGLTLVNQILNEEIGRLENERSIKRDSFTQTLKIKM